MSPLLQVCVCLEVRSDLVHWEDWRDLENWRVSALKVLVLNWNLIVRLHEQYICYHYLVYGPNDTTQNCLHAHAHLHMCTVTIIYAIYTTHTYPQTHLLMPVCQLTQWVVFCFLPEICLKVTILFLLFLNTFFVPVWNYSPWETWTAFSEESQLKPSRYNYG